MPAYLLPSPKQAFFTNTGAPLVGGKVFTYLAGTNTPANTWADANQTALNTNPVILDARGEASIFWNGAYKVVLKDSADNTIYTQDNVTAFDQSTVATLSGLAAASGAGLIGFSHSNTYPAGSVGEKLRRSISVKDAPYSAKGDGTTDDTAAIQSAVNAIVAAGGGELVFPAGTYKQGPVTLTNAVGVTISGDGATILVTGDMSSANDNTNRQAAFKFSGTCTRVTFEGLRFQGDGVLANKQRGIGYNYDTPPTLTDIQVSRCTFDSLVMAVVLPGVQSASLTQNTVSNGVGTASGLGLGFVTELASVTKPTDVRIIGNRFYRTGRHAIYTNFVEGCVVSANTFREHSPAFAGGATTGKWAVAISRCSGVSVDSNTFWNCSDGCLGIDQDGTYSVFGVSVEGNTIWNTNGASIYVGRTGSTGDCARITITGNTIVTAAAYTAADIIVTDVQHLKIADNVIDADRGYTVVKTIIDVSEYQASYFSNVDISNNTGVVSSSSAAYLVRLSAGLSASSGGRIFLRQNEVSGATRLYLYAPSGACTNSQIVTDWTFEQTITAAGTPSIAGYNRFNINLASAGSITSFANGYDAKTIDLFFTNANATLTNAMYLAGAVNFTPTSSDKMSLSFRQSANNWFENSRSLN